MKAIRSRIFAFLMIGVVLTFNTGMGLVERTCLMSGKKFVSSEPRKGCCSKKSSSSTQSQGKCEFSIQATDCCEVESYYIHVDFVSLQEKFSKLFVNLYFAIIEKAADVFKALLSRSETACSYTNSSPPHAGRVLLTKHCILRL